MHSDTGHTVSGPAIDLDGSEASRRRGRGPSASACLSPRQSLRAPTPSLTRSARNSLRPSFFPSLNAPREERPFVPSLAAEVRPRAGVPPIPVMPFAVVNCVSFGDLLIAGVVGPFLFNMVYDLAPGIEDGAAATWAGVLAAAFFFAQFLTSLLWSAVADRYGKRIVLFSAALGSTVSIILYGLSPSLYFALAMRLVQGFFNGAVGVAKGAVKDLTVPANEGQAFSVLGFWWGMGGIVGPMLGGYLEHPAQKYPSVFGEVQLFSRYPYLLPCLGAAACTAMGVLLAPFTGPNGGPRGEAFPPIIVGLEEEDRLPDQETGHPLTERPSSFAASEGTVTSPPTRSQAGMSSTSLTRPKGDPRSRASLHQQALLASTRYSHELESQAMADEDTGLEQNGAIRHTTSAAAQSRMPFVYRFVLANDDVPVHLSDFWVASALSGDEALNGEDEEPIVFFDDSQEAQSVDDEHQFSFQRSLSRSEEEDESHSEATVDSHSEDSEDLEDLTEDSALVPVRREAGHFSTSRSSALMPFEGSSALRPLPSWRRSTSVTPRIPSLYRFSGLEMPWHNRVSFLDVPRRPRESGTSVATATRRMKYGSISEPTPLETVEEPLPSGVFRLLPLVIILHYGLLGLHASMFDQVFLSFLVAPMEIGGLGLTAAHFAELIAFMSICQLGFQFYVYPYLGPPHGPLTHLGMLRLGLAFYLPTYTLFPLLRVLPLPERGVMALMVTLSSIRWLANICAFTAVSVLMNALCPPELVSLANGLAQTVSSAARFIGPLTGGVIWGFSIGGGPDARPWPFNYHFGFWIVGCLGLLGFLQSWWIR